MTDQLATLCDLRLDQRLMGTWGRFCKRRTYVDSLTLCHPEDIAGLTIKESIRFGMIRFT